MHSLIVFRFGRDLSAGFFGWFRTGGGGRRHVFKLLPVFFVAVVVRRVGLVAVVGGLAFPGLRRRGRVSTAGLIAMVRLLAVVSLELLGPFLVRVRLLAGGRLSLPLGRGRPIWSWRRLHFRCRLARCGLRVGAPHFGLMAGGAGIRLGAGVGFGRGLTRSFGGRGFALRRHRLQFRRGRTWCRFLIGVFRVGLATRGFWIGLEARIRSGRGLTRSGGGRRFTLHGRSPHFG